MPYARPMRLAELLGALALATDVGMGLPDGVALRTAYAAASLARALDLDPEETRRCYYLGLLRMMGCTAESHAAAAVMGDELAVRAQMLGLDVGDPMVFVSTTVRNVGADRGPLGRARAVGRSLARMPALYETIPAHCEVATDLATRFGLGELLREGLAHTFERWDGSGAPGKLRGGAIPIAARVVAVAADAVTAHLAFGAARAKGDLARRSGRGLEPALVPLAIRMCDEELRELDTGSSWSLALAAEPTPWLVADEDRVDDVLTGIADFADLKCRYTPGHSRAVARLAEGAAKRLRLEDALVRDVMRAGLVHDVGRVGITASVWNKPGPLTEGERERVQTHTYLGDRILRRCAALERVARIATAAHERVDGSGYHRHAEGAEVTIAQRVLMAADVYCALREDRPHRGARSARDARSVLAAEAEAGRLDARAVEAVVDEAEARPLRRPSERSELSAREVEVARLLARGLTNKEIASALAISPKTAGHHVEKIFAKIGVTTRAAAALWAARHGLVGPGG